MICRISIYQTQRSYVKYVRCTQPLPMLQSPAVRITDSAAAFTLSDRRIPVCHATSIPLIYIMHKRRLLPAFWSAIFGKTYNVEDPVFLKHGRCRTAFHPLSNLLSKPDLSTGTGSLKFVVFKNISIHVYCKRGCAYPIRDKDRFSVDILIWSAISHKRSATRISTFRFTSAENKSSGVYVALGICAVFAT